MISINLEGRTALVTGASRGIGRAIAERLHAAGARVIGTRASLAEPEPDSPCADWIVADFSDRGQIEHCAEAVAQLAPDILINNAGINKIAPFVEIDPEDFLRIQQVNVYAPFRLSQAALPAMVARKWGRIVGVSSIWGKVGKEQRASYAASKFAIDGLTLALAVEHATDGVLANCIAPGFTDTELTRRVLGEEGIAKLTATVPARRMAQVDEIAELALWLASPANGYLTGQNIAIDGGFARA
jgi:NAD(P)-dependent dehydrogenase (short-subunit alcohol dehydrogenase family)